MSELRNVDFESIKAEIDQRYAEYQESKRVKEIQYNSNCEKIERLYAVKRNIKEYKDIAEENYKSIKNYAEDEDNFGEWAGNKYTNFCLVLNSEIVTGYNSYVNRIDEVLDEICLKITELENENMRLSGDILGIVSSLNSLGNRIEMWMN